MAAGPTTGGHIDIKQLLLDVENQRFAPVRPDIERDGFQRSKFLFRSTVLATVQVRSGDVEQANGSCWFCLKLP
jgi:hypothetical protein